MLDRLGLAADGRRYHTREYLTAGVGRPPAPGEYTWAVEHDGHSIGGAELRVDSDQHCATYSVGLHRIQLEVLATNARAIGCYVACGFRHEGVRREAELYPDGWKNFILIGTAAV